MGCSLTLCIVRSPSRAERPAHSDGARDLERGSVTAEFATVIPAVVLVLAMCLAGLQLATTKVRLQQAAAVSARAVARGEPVGIGSAVMPGALLRVDRRGELVCVTASAQKTTPGWLIGGAAASASSCALDAGR